MERCLELAGCGRGNVAPNPMVGAVIVCDDRVIGEGYHRCFGEAHAEVNAIASVKDESLLLKSTLYVNLEPCSHYGKTPPCAEYIIRKGIPRVVVACSDPYPEVSGRGIRMLCDAGVEVITGGMENEAGIDGSMKREMVAEVVMEREAKMLNRIFITAHKKRRPYIILKWAQSKDGFIDRIRKDKSQKPVQLSTPMTRMIVHKLRSEVQAIMVGTNTAILDDPSLTVRHWVGRSPTRILIDKDLCVPMDSHLYDTSHRTIIYTNQKNADPRYDIHNKKNIEYVKMDDCVHFLRNIASDLYAKNINSLLVEGGASLHRSFINEGLWDEAIVETSPVSLNNGVKAAEILLAKGVQIVDEYSVLNHVSPFLGSSVIEHYINQSI